MCHHLNRIIFILFCGLLLFGTRGAAQSLNFTTIDALCDVAPPTSCPNGIARATAASGINPAGEIVGAFTDGVGKQHGFLLSQGQFTTLDFPGAVGTSANGISPTGDIVGNYRAPVSSAPPSSPDYCPAATSAACIKGFLYRQGKYSTVLFSGHPGAVPQRITPDGDIYGCLHDFDTGISMFGAIWTRFGQSSLTGSGGELADPSQSVPMSMNNGATPGGNMIVGLWTDMSNHRHGFVVHGGSFQSFDVPGSLLTAIWDINPEQEFVGTYIDNTGHRHGFLQLPDGSVPINVDVPSAAATIAFGINPDGAIVGQYTASGHTHGFLAVPSDTN
ncbi:MAG TPA: hypothetical protein VGR55_10360 [Candidatus Acidoferrum sp.]|nr:hypothetical protein [Candidatus Acidoferrum sp.]